MKLAISLCALLAFTTISAKTHLIAFGGALGNNYVPLALPEVHIGDTVRWEGEFSAHPLTSDTIPVGATPFANDAGTVFEYVPTVEGIYGYHCQFHGAMGVGMFGGFQVVSASVKQTKTVEGELLQNYPNPAQGTTTMSFTLTKSTKVNLGVFTLDGKEVANVAQGTLSQGQHSYTLDVSSLPAGLYFYRLFVNGEAITRELVVVK